MVDVKENLWWVYYTDSHRIYHAEQIGKWMYFFDDRSRVEELCLLAVKNKIVYTAKHTNDSTGVMCLYSDLNDIDTHKKVISFMLQQHLIKKSKQTGKYYNISFKLDEQTRCQEYGDQFKPKITLSTFIDLSSGKWIDLAHK